MHSILTRSDREFDSIKWAFETHLKRPNDPAFNFAILYGNEDSPTGIDFWYQEPLLNQPPDLSWSPDAHLLTIYIATKHDNVLNDGVRFAVGLKGPVLGVSASVHFSIVRSDSLDADASRDDDSDPF